METTSVFFFGLLFGLAAAFAGLRAAGVSAERIGRGAAQILVGMPVLHRLMAFMRLHRKAAAAVGVVAVIFFTPSLVAAILLVAALVAVKQLGTVKQPGKVGVSDSTAGAGTISGVLLDHGEAPYLNDTDNSRSYYVELKRGDRTKVVWGVGLADAIGRASANLGDTVSLTHKGRQQVSVPVEPPDAGGRAVWKDAIRNIWHIEVTQPS